VKRALGAHCIIQEFRSARNLPEECIMRHRRYAITRRRIFRQVTKRRRCCARQLTIPRLGGSSVTQSRAGSLHWSARQRESLSVRRGSARGL
jgi:hypothetical protein